MRNVYCYVYFCTNISYFGENFISSQIMEQVIFRRYFGIRRERFTAIFVGVL